MANPKRVALSKKVRFEVFKRDSFKCQYCGRSAPEVVLHVDHIKPVSKGGTNDIFNLITSCADCNSCKGARKLSDASMLEKQKKQLDELNEKREQLEMMMEWQSELQSFKKKSIDIIENKLKDFWGDQYYLNTTDKATIARMIDQFGIDEIITSIDIAISNNKLKKVFAPYLYGILRKRKIDVEDPETATIYRAYYFARKKYYNEFFDFTKHFKTERDFIEFFFINCKNYVKSGNTLEELLALVRQCKGYHEFSHAISGGLNG